MKEEEGLKKVEIVKKEAEDNKNKKEKEGKKKKVAIIFGYCGLDYQGLQRCVLNLHMNELLMPFAKEILEHVQLRMI